MHASPSATIPPRRSKSPAAEAQACRYIIDVIYEHCGIRLHDGKEALIKARLGKRMRHWGFADLAEYCDYLRTAGDAEEFTRMVDALTTNFTNFLRENDHFQFMVRQALPMATKARNKTFHVWSAASSSGEEPYTIAFYLAENQPAIPGWNWQIIASDISTKVLDKARLGVYPKDRVAALPQEWLHKYFQKGIGQWEGHYRVKRSIAQRVTFRQINLVENYQQDTSFHLIFCRNVMIYFDRATQERLVRQLCRFLLPAGFLIIGHSESLNGLDVPLKCLRPSIYQSLGT